MPDDSPPPNSPSEAILLPMVGIGEKTMSNPRNWRGKGRTPTPNSRQKRNGLYLDKHTRCHRCGAPSQEAHHHLPVGHPDRYDWRHMKALCVSCHVTVHQHLKMVFTPRQRGV